ncbi:MAG TPA: hypothetical protein VFS35_09990, partial [Terrimicrobiaceae bacterium]|nr:hypothetical protein [Terrimicrobiaceae bacterium]
MLRLNMPLNDASLLLSDLARARDRLALSPLNGYRVRVVSSGLGDMLALAALQSAIGDLLGLRFEGVVLPASYSRPYYADLVERLGLGSLSADPMNSVELVLDGKRVTRSQRTIEAELSDLVASHPASRTLVISFPSVAAASGIQDHTALRKGFFDSRFRAEVVKLGRNLFSTAEHPRTVTLHLRLGDVAAVRIGGFVVIPVFALREDHPAGAVRDADVARVAVTRVALSVVDECLEAARLLRKRFSGVKLQLVSDGYDRARQFLLRPDVRARLSSRGLDYQPPQIEPFLQATESRIRNSGLFDRIVFGESDSQEWMASVECLLHSGTVISSARGFVASMLTFFLPEHGHRRFYSPLNS